MLANKKAAGKGAITFAGVGAELLIAKGDVPANTLVGLGVGDAIALRGVTANSASVFQSRELVVKNGGTSVAAFAVSGIKGTPEFSTLANAKGTVVYADASVAEFKAQHAKLDEAADGFAIADTAANLQAAFAKLSADPKFALGVVTDNAPLTLTAVEAAKNGALAKLRNAKGSKVQVNTVGSAINMQNSLSALVPEALHVASIAFSEAAPTMTLTAAEAKKDAGLIAKIEGSWVLDVQTAADAFAITGHGDNLTIDAVAGKDQITGGGSNETFVLKSGFGQASLVDFSAHLSGAGQDLVELSASDFANFSALLNDASQTGANVVITAANQDKLTLDNMSIAALSQASSDFKFV